MNQVQARLAHDHAELDALLDEHSILETLKGVAHSLALELSTEHRARP
jgi:hypothetical protein